MRIPKDGDAILAAPFDVESMEAYGAPVAVWSGLSAFATCFPGRYVVTRDGVLFCRPGQLGANRAIVLLDATGRLVSWSSKGRVLDFPPAISPDGRQLACQIISTRGIDEIWISPDGKVLAFQTLESSELSSYVAVFHPGGAAGRPVETETSGSSWHEWSADGKSLFVQDERNHRMRIPVSTTPELAVGAPTEICDRDRSRITMWSALPGDRFLVGLRNVNEDEVASYNVVLSWTEILKRKMEAER